MELKWNQKSELILWSALISLNWNAHNFDWNYEILKYINITFWCKVVEEMIIKWEFEGAEFYTMLPFWIFSKYGCYRFGKDRKKPCYRFGYHSVTVLVKVCYRFGLMPVTVLVCYRSDCTPVSKHVALYYNY